MQYCPSCLLVRTNIPTPQTSFALVLAKLCAFAVVPPILLFLIPKFWQMASSSAPTLIDNHMGQGGTFNALRSAWRRSGENYLCIHMHNAQAICSIKQFVSSNFVALTPFSDGSENSCIPIHPRQKNKMQHVCAPNHTNEGWKTCKLVLQLCINHDLRCESFDTTAQCRSAITQRYNDILGLQVVDGDIHECRKAVGNM